MLDRYLSTIKTEQISQKLPPKCHKGLDVKYNHEPNRNSYWKVFSITGAEVFLTHDVLLNHKEIQ